MHSNALKIFSFPEKSAHGVARSLASAQLSRVQTIHTHYCSVEGVLSKAPLFAEALSLIRSGMHVRAQHVALRNKSSNLLVPLVDQELVSWGGAGFAHRI